MAIDASVNEADFWGEDLYRWPMEVLRDSAIPRSAVEYLTRVGLPKLDDWTFSFLQEPHRVSRERSSNPQFLFGYDSSVPMFIECYSGKVVEVPGGGASSVYLNSDIAKFGKFLQVYQQYRVDVSSLDPEDELAAQELIDRVESEMAGVDSSALESSSGGWSQIIEQMRDGLL